MTGRFFKIQFADKSAWNEMKDDLKSQFKELEIKYQYSEEKPNFTILYQSNSVKIQITWVDGLLVELTGNENVPAEHIDYLSSIFDTLILFGGELVDGSRPEEWAA